MKKNLMGTISGAAYGLVASFTGGYELFKHGGGDLFSSHRLSFLDMIRNSYIDTELADKFILTASLPSLIPSIIYEALTSRTLSDSPLESGIMLVSTVAICGIAGNLIQKSIRKNPTKSRI